MFQAVDSPYLVPFNGEFRVKTAPTVPPEEAGGKKKLKKQLQKEIEKLDELQRQLYAQNQFAVLLVFQAPDAAGKDSTIRAVMRGINPAGCQVYSFQAPSAEELDHDFLWRTSRCLPERGRIGIFNRSYYEEVIIVRLFPDFLKKQQLPGTVDLKTIWEDRYRSIRDHEEHLARNGTVIIKFWLNVSRDEQRKRFLSRLDKPHKHYKFAPEDIEKRKYFDQLRKYYQDALNATSRGHAPWYAVPADDKPWMRLQVAEIIVRSLQSLNLSYPTAAKQDKSRFDEWRQMLLEEDAK